MQEGQVTIEGETLPLPVPFLVLATQNPIVYEGTFPLPEAQLDRFMLKLTVGYPSIEEEKLILKRRRERRQDEVILREITNAEQVLEMREAVECYRAALALHPDSTVVRYYLGRLYFKLEEPNRALEQYAIALRQRPDDGSFLFHIASCRYELGQPEPALAILSGLVERREPS